MTPTVRISLGEGALGASGWEYITANKGGVEESLAVLHEEVFEELYGRDDDYGSVEELWADEEFMGEEGTHSILDIQRVVHTSAAPSTHAVEDYGTLRPMAPDRILHHFGADRPTPERFQELLDESYAAMDRPPHDRGGTLLDECRMRWTGLCVVLYTGEEPSHLGIFGYWGD
ncbi:hypothetical protein ABIE67_007325 [Streptomyces sp. V4I8]|uniref:hypothetical protein n=1 Tax=Streptomyces sp. V4I8 TaxID=3156469 RepID=UPI003518194D